MSILSDYTIWRPFSLLVLLSAPRASDLQPSLIFMQPVTGFQVTSVHFVEECKDTSIRGPDFSRDRFPLRRQRGTGTQTAADFSSSSKCGDLRRNLSAVVVSVKSASPNATAHDDQWRRVPTPVFSQANRGILISTVSSPDSSSERKGNNAPDSFGT